ncbi:MAG: tetratricopeptide repeat protein [Verrucomicrobiales bacterium]
MQAPRSFPTQCQFFSVATHHTAAFCRIGVVCLLTFLGAAPALGQHQLVRANDTQEGEILGVSGTNIMVRVAAGEVGVPLASVQRVVMPAPEAFGRGQSAMRENNYEAAISELQRVVDQFAGLPVDWARSATAMLGDAYVGLGRFDEAEDTYQKFQSVYSGAEGSAQASVGMARVDLERGRLPEARARLEPITELALKQLHASADQGRVYTQAFLLLGRLEEAAGNPQQALEHYMRAVAVFPQDAPSSQEAQERAAALQGQNVVVP